MARSRAWTRYHRRRTIKRKADMLRRWREDPLTWCGGDLGVFSKNKIHCSCWMCRVKSYDELSCRDKQKVLHYLNEVDEKMHEAGDEMVQTKVRFRKK